MQQENFINKVYKANQTNRKASHSHPSASINFPPKKLFRNSKATISHIIGNNTNNNTIVISGPQIRLST